MPLSSHDEQLNDLWGESKDEIDIEQLHKESFAVLASHPLAWEITADRLKEAADSLRDAHWPTERQDRDARAAVADFQVGPVYMMLIGMAVEALVKGILVAKRPELVTSASSRLNFRIDRLQLTACVVDFHLPIDASLRCVDIR